MIQSGSLALASCGRVSGKYCRILASCVYAHQFTDTFTDSGHSALRNSLMHKHQYLEARVGIGQITPPLRCQYA